MSNPESTQLFIWEALNLTHNRVACPFLRTGRTRGVAGSGNRVGWAGGKPNATSVIVINFGRTAQFWYTSTGRRGQPITILAS